MGLNGNVIAVPLFADPANGDFHLKSEAGRWDPLFSKWVFDDVTSPCIDAGDPESELQAEPAHNGGRINMGAYGGTPQASRSLVKGDINGDGTVNMEDLAILAADWMETASQ